MILFVISLVLGAVAWLCFFWAGTIQKRADAVVKRVLGKYQLDEYRCSGTGRVIGLCFSRRTVIIADPTFDSELSWEAIRAVEIVRNGVTVTTVDRGSQLAGATMGGIAFGPLGAVVGGLTGKARSVERLRSIGLKLRLNDIQHPVHEVTFGTWAGKGGADPGGMFELPEVKAVERFQAHCLNAMTDSASLSEPAATSAVS